MLWQGKLVATQKQQNRSAGILLHPTSLPGPFGIGDLGSAAFLWVDSLARARQTWWQILPLGPTGYGDSPYQCFSAFAGNPYLISPEFLARDGLLKPPDLTAPHFPAEHVDFGPVIKFKVRLLGRAWDNFKANAAPALKPQFEEFCAQEARWLDDYALFMALKDAHGGKSWLDWPRDLVIRQSGALDRARRQNGDAIRLHKFRQFLFFKQWRELKRYANSHGIKLIGDVPIFVSSDSADVWANPDLFQLDEHRKPRCVAGVPPDYFSATGQLWGNPLYDWPKLKLSGYAWWVARIRAMLEQVDLVRLDHFRGFESYWEVAAGQPTAQFGHWAKGPGDDFFDVLRRELGGLPMVAEDLGMITDAVGELRDRQGLAGMRILQFAFDNDAADRFLPHNYETTKTMVYTGTHDNDTTRGWYSSLPDHRKDFVRRYLARDGHDISWDLIRLAWSSVADYALAPLQDVLDLGTETRMNLPGRATGNWGWRFRQEQLHDGLLDRLREQTEIYNRTPR